jgi:hypothetical protein
MSTPPVPPPPPSTTTEAAVAQPRWRTWLANRDRAGKVALVVAAGLLVTTIAATSLWLWNYNSSLTWQSAAEEARAERDELRGELAGVQSKADTLEAASETMQDKISTLESEASAVAQQATELAEQETALAEREAAVSATEQRVAANTITEGTWTVGVDIEPGTYRTKEPVGSSCYWGIYRSGTNKDDIIQNDIVTGGTPTVNLAEGQDFSSTRCGSWVKQ